MSDIAPTGYATMAATLGLPIAALQGQSAGRPGYTLYSRRTERGIVYLNFTGTVQTVNLPAGATYQDRDGRVVSSLTIPDLTGDYVTVVGAKKLAAEAACCGLGLPAVR